MSSRKLCVPLVNCILVSHTQVTTRADRNQIIYRCDTTPAFRGIVTALIVENTHAICAPNNLTLCIELGSNFQ